MLIKQLKIADGVQHPLLSGRRPREVGARAIRPFQPTTAHGCLPICARRLYKTFKRRTAAAWFTAHGDAVPMLSMESSRVRLAIFIALAQIYGVMVIEELRFRVIVDFMVEGSAVVMVQRTRYRAMQVHSSNRRRALRR
ncbi:hypothetical protein [Caballeronia arvi]|uniref:hypothetical protein n=1 Tax=Caballeronia arvi TaxID=1777135 RepID=UPI0007722939|nr:hypothetical protein [Caballeronia arvi]